MLLPLRQVLLLSLVDFSAAPGGRWVGLLDNNAGRYTGCWCLLVQEAGKGLLVCIAVQ